MNAPDPILDTLSAQFDKVFSPQHRTRAVDWSNSPENRERLAEHREALAKLPVPTLSPESR